MLGSAGDRLAGTDPLSVAAGDFNGDGELDLAVANAGTDTIEILLNNGNGTFTAGNSYAHTRGYYGNAIPYDVIAGDFNGDGNLDFAVANYDQATAGSGTSRSLLGQWRRHVSPSPANTRGAGHGTSFDPISIAAANFNGDGSGILDLAVANYYQNLVDVLTGNGNGTFSTTPATYAWAPILAPSWPPTSTATAIPTWPWQITAATPSPCS